MAIVRGEVPDLNLYFSCVGLVWCHGYQGGRESLDPMILGSAVISLACLVTKSYLHNTQDIHEVYVYYWYYHTKMQ